MVCSGCNKFPSFEEGDPELDLSIDNDGEITGTCRIFLNCAECGSECKEYTIDVQITADEEIEAHQKKHKDCVLEITDESASFTDRSESTKSRTLKNGTVKVTHISPRYRRRFYGAEITGTITCSCDKPLSIAFEFSDEVQASGMEELS